LFLLLWQRATSDSEVDRERRRLTEEEEQSEPESEGMAAAKGVAKPAGGVASSFQGCPRFACAFVVVVGLYTSDARPQWAAFMQSSPGAAPGAHRARRTRAKGGPCRIRTLRAVKPTGHPQAGVLSRRRA
jgi:hypothetical protein